MALTAVDLNCDMGESFGPWSLGDAPDSEIMGVISSANVAAGFHAGDPNHMDDVVKLAVRHGVAIGAHPGYRDLQGFGRRVIAGSPEEIVNDILYQLGALREFGRRHGVRVQHVKPHGALYMEAAKSVEMSRLMVDALGRSSPDTLLYCMGASETYRVACDADYPVIREFYADRDYDKSGSIVFRRKVGAMEPEAIAEKCLRACREGKVKTVEGDDIDIEFESICFHSDTPGALDIGKAVRAALTENGVAITSASELSRATP